MEDEFHNGNGAVLNLRVPHLFSLHGIPRYGEATRSMRLVQHRGVREQRPKPVTVDTTACWELATEDWPKKNTALLRIKIDPN